MKSSVLDVNRMATYQLVQSVGNFSTEDKAKGPGPMAPEAYHGIAGDFLKIVEPHSEADPAALLISFLVAVGNYLSRSAYYVADRAKHFTNEFAVIVGDSSRGRKGTSWNQVKQVFEKADMEYFQQRCVSGLSSGEGIIWAVRNPIYKDEPIKDRGRVSGYENVMVDSGVEDKRLMVVEGEFARVLDAARREGNTLSAILRESWDSGSLNILTKNNATTATNAHISIVAHVTVEELSSLGRS